MSIKNVDLSNNTNKITGNIEENLNNNKKKNVNNISVELKDKIKEKQ